MRSIVALHSDYCTAEPFVEYDYELRLQKIGPRSRALKRFSSGWKGNTSVLKTEEVPMEGEWQAWLDAAAAVFGGLDICSLDVVHRAADGALFILELNDTAIGLCNACEEEDHRVMRDLALVRMATGTATGASGAATEAAAGEAAQLELQRLRAERDQAGAARDAAQAEVAALREQAEQRKKCAVM